MPRTVTVLVGTKKGAYRFKSGASRERWRMSGHDFAGQPVYHVAFDPRDGKSLFAAVNATWGGPRIEVSRDLGASWSTAKNPAFPKGSPLTCRRGALPAEPRPGLLQRGDRVAQRHQGLAR